MSFRCLLHRRNLVIAAMTMTMVFVAQLAHAQFRASIQGTVTDPTGAVIPNATLTLNDADTGSTLTATSNNSGVFNGGHTNFHPQN